MNAASGIAWGLREQDIEAAGRDGAARLLEGLRTRGREIAGRYRVEELLGAGSSGIVLSARHVYLRRRVTLKILRCTTLAGASAQRRHMPARHVAAGLRSVHVARTIDSGFTSEGAPFIVTERLEGRTLADELEQRGRLPVGEAVGWILQACEALAEAHAAGIVHGDLKPRNLFLAKDPSLHREHEARILKVLDFGMVTPLEEAEGDHATTWFTTPAYLSPEQILAPEAVDLRTDIWALGVILHELLDGAPPFGAESVAGVLVAVTSDEPAELRADVGGRGDVRVCVPAELAAIIRACLAKEPSERPSSVPALVRALAPFAGGAGLALAASVDAATERGRALPRRHVLPPRIDLPEAEPTLPSPTTSTSPAMRRRRAREAARRRSRRAFFLAAAIVLAAAATLAMPARQLTQRALRDLAEPPVVDGARARARARAGAPADTPVEVDDTVQSPLRALPSPVVKATAAVEMGTVVGVRPSPPPAQSQQQLAAPALAAPPAAQTRSRQRSTQGFTHPSQLR